MPRVDWSNLEVTEQWLSSDHSDSIAILREQEDLQRLSELILKAFERHCAARTKQQKKQLAEQAER